MNYMVFETAWGWCAAIGEGNVISNFTFAHKSSKQAFESLNSSLLKRVTTTETDWSPTLRASVVAYFLGKRVDFSSFRVLQGIRELSDFEMEVYNACRLIPCGETANYGELASKVGHPGAARAVGSCMQKNMVPLIIPCHRVVRSDGKIGNFSAPGGADTKTKLLELERKMASASKIF
ncbi:MAG: methylated-DNA--[protein]-cysteine S-methyltransferase [Thermoguttaceae bacterium]